MTPEEARDALDALDPEPKWESLAVKPGDRVAFDAFGRKVLATVIRCDEDGVTIREESPYTLTAAAPEPPPATTPRRTPMTDQTIPAVTDDDRKLARKWAEPIASDMDTWGDGIRTVARVVLDAVPGPPTLADMTPEERAKCRWMQVDVEGHEGRAVIVDFYVMQRHVRLLWPDGGVGMMPWEKATPRPDLPRLGWPTNRTTQAAADQPVAEGSVWGDAEELRRACAASNFDHITVTDKNGDVAQWFGKIAYWTPAGPRQHSAPFTVAHTGKRDEK